MVATWNRAFVTAVVIYTSLIWTISCWSFALRGRVKCRERVFHWKREEEEGRNSVGDILVSFAAITLSVESLACLVTFLAEA